MERKRSETLKLFVVSDVGRRSTLLSSTPSTRWWQFFWPRSGETQWLGGITEFGQYKELLEWAIASRDAEELLPLPN
jgi:hypothetical protein